MENGCGRGAHSQPDHPETNPRSTMEVGIKVRGKLIKALQFVDKEAMLASREQDIQRMMDGLNRTTKEYEMKINTKKTNIMKISREEGEEKNMKITTLGNTIFLA